MRLLFWSSLLFGLWMVLTLSWHVENILVGLGISFGIALFYVKLFQDSKLQSINIYWLFVYILVLLKNLITSNFKITKRTLSKNMRLDPAIVGVKTTLNSEWKILLLANSITLTPGTLTLEVEDDILYIHVIECKSQDKKYEIIREFEEIISKI